MVMHGYRNGRRTINDGDSKHMINIRDTYGGLTLRCILASVSLALVLAANAAAQSLPIETISSRASAVRFYISNNGILALDPRSASGSFVYPPSSGASYLFGGGLWFGARKMVDADRKKLVFVTYNPHSGMSWAHAGERHVPELYTSGGDTNVDQHIYTSTQFNRVTGSYTGSDIPRHAWPLWITPQTGQTVTPMSTGTFDPYVWQRGTQHAGSGGEHMGPAFVGGVDEQIVTRYHDNDLGLYEIVDGAERAAYPIGLQVQQIVYAWEEGRYRNVVLVQYHIRNISSDTLFDCVIGQASDPDLGADDNDRISFYNPRPDLRTGYCWTEPDSLGEYGTLLMSLIEAPNTDSLGFIDNRNRSLFLSGGRAGAFPYWSSSDTKTSTQRYDFMTGGGFTTDIKAEDQCTMLASRVFSMRPGDTAYFAMMYAVLDSQPPRGTQGRKNAASVASAPIHWDALEHLVASINSDYYSRLGFAREVQSGISHEYAEGAYTATVIPNPAGEAATIRLMLPVGSTVKVRLANTIGQVMMERDLGSLELGMHDVRLDLAGLPAGFYMAMIETGAGIRTIPITIRR
jgi:hypothetical protein